MITTSSAHTVPLRDLDLKEPLRSNILRAMRQARLALLMEMKGLSFRNLDDWVKIVDVHPDILLLESQDNGGRVVVEDTRWDDLLAVIRKSPNMKRQSGDYSWKTIRPGEGEVEIMDWPRIVLHSGRRVPEIRRMGVIEALSDPLRGENLWST